MPGRIDQDQLIGLAQHGMGRALDDVDHQRIGQLARDARILDPGELEQLIAQRVDVDQRHRLVLLGQDALVDLEFVEVLDPAHVDAADLEAGASGQGGKLCLGHRRNAREAGDHPGEDNRAAEDDGQEDAV